MLCAIDIETRGLDATQYITGCLVKEKRKKPLIFRKKEDLWNSVLELAISEAKRGKMLNIYSHNASYDTAGYVDLNDKHLVFFSNRPFIWAYRLTEKECDKYGIKHEEGQGKEIIKFLDTWAIFKMSLKKLGNLINLPKMDTPKELFDKQLSEDLIEKQLIEIEKYMVRDAQICLKSIEFLKKKLREEKISIKRLYTINQIAIAYIMNKLKKLPDQYKEPLLWDKEKGITRRSFRYDEIHNAYRGGRVEAFVTGTFKENVNYTDNNNLYSFSASNMRCPDLKSERMYREPLLTGWDEKELFNMIGLSRCLVKNVNDNLGFLPIRTEFGSFYPKKNKYLIGTWTHEELLLAIQNGYKVIKVEWSVVYKEAPNPFTLIFNECYEKRKSGSLFDDYFYKQIANSGIGKMAQRRTNQEIVLDDVEKCEQYKANKYKVIKGIGLNYMYKKTETKFHKKNYYMPIIPCLINAYARCHMYKYFKKIPLKDLIYTDTDSCVFKNNHFDKFPISKKLGEFKVEYENTNMIVYGRKTYSIGDEIKISGINKRGIDIKDFENGFVSTKKMVTINTTKETEKVGTFINEDRNLLTQEENHNKIMKMMKDEKLLIDNDIENVSYYEDEIKQMV